MIPILLDLHFIKIYTFGVFAAFSLVWALFLLFKHIKLTSYKEEDMFDYVFVSLLGALGISRLVFVALNFNDFGFNFLKIILVNGYPGMSLVGFILGFYLVLAICFVRAGIEIKKGFDYTVTPMLVALSFGKIGSLLGGVDVGVKTSLPLAVTYVGYGGLRHIVAFYEAIIFLLCAFVARQILFSTRRQQTPYGMTFVWFIFSFGGSIALLDKIKENHLYLGQLSLNMTIGMILVVVSTVFSVIVNRQLIITKSLELVKKIKLPTGVKKNAKSDVTKTTRGNTNKTTSKEKKS